MKNEMRPLLSKKPIVDCLVNVNSSTYRTHKLFLALEQEKKGYYRQLKQNLIASHCQS